MTLTDEGRRVLSRLLMSSRQYPLEVGVEFVLRSASVDRVTLDALLDELEPLLEETPSE